MVLLLGLHDGVAEVAPTSPHGQAADGLQYRRCGSIEDPDQSMKDKADARDRITIVYRCLSYDRQMRVTVQLSSFIKPLRIDMKQILQQLTCPATIRSKPPQIK